MSFNGRRVVPAVIIAVTLGVGIIIGSLVSLGVRAARPAAFAPDAAILPPPSPADLSTSFSKIADALEPAVVNINTETTVRVSQRRFHTPDDSPFGDFFDRFFQFGPGDGSAGAYRQQSLGSGVILDKNGYILTNYHVITQDGLDRPVDQIRVQLHGDDSSSKGFEARIIGSDKWTDLAVIKIDPGKPLTAASFGESDSMRVGDWVLAIGSPFGLESTVTAGIISAKGRSIEGGPEGQFKRFLQTDAAINPGNSGGPLVNLAGQVVGINTAIATRRGSYDGVGFAIPSDTARKVYNSIISNGSVRRGAIGVSFYNQNNQALLRSFGADHGVVVNSVESGSPAERAGLKMGDVILSVNGKPISSGDELVEIVSESEIGRKLDLQVLRDKKAISAQVEVGDRNKVLSELQQSRDDGDDAQGAEPAGGVLGLSVRNLTGDQAKEVATQLNLSATQGIIVTDTDPSGFSAELGLFRGDVILSINHQPLKSVDDFNRVQLQLKSGNDVLFLLARRTPQRTFTTLYLADRLP
jgi:serine protease Do